MHEQNDFLNILINDPENLKLFKGLQNLAIEVNLSRRFS